MRQERCAAVYFSKGDTDDGGVRSFEAILAAKLFDVSLVLSNRSAANVSHFLPVVDLRATRKRNLLEKLSDALALASANLRAYRVLSKQNVQQILCNDFWSFWHVFFACLVLRIEILFFVRDTPAPGKSFSLAWALPFAVSRRVISLSEELRAVVLATPFVRYFCPKARFVVLPSLVEGGDDLQNRAVQNKDVFCLGYVAAFRRKKQQLEFIKYVVAPLRQRIDNLQVVFLGGISLGDVSYRQQCQAAVQQLALGDCVEFVEHQLDPTPYYQRFDLTCLASTHEGLARVMLESLAQATPVVSFAVCSADEVLVKNDCGIVVAIADYPAMVEAVVRLSRDFELRRQLGANGQNYIKTHHQLEAVRKQVVSLLC